MLQTRKVFTTKLFNVSQRPAKLTSFNKFSAQPLPRSFHSKPFIYNNIFSSSTNTTTTTTTTTTTPSKRPLVANKLVDSNEAAFENTWVFNEQYGENDTQHEHPLKVGISKNAVKQLQKLMREDGNANLAVQVGVESGGCHGFQYHLKLVDLFKDEIINVDLNEKNLKDLNADVLEDDEISIFVRDGAKVTMNNASLMILRESKIDYVKELIGTSFKVIDSPYTKSACGCGSSFDVDFSKMDS